MEKIAPVERLLDRLFGMISPQLHSAVLEVMEKVIWDQPPVGSESWSRDNILQVARCWPGATPGISVVSNRASICHLDVNGYKRWYDLLVSAGTHTRCWFRLPDLNLDMKYLPGTVIALNGRILRHEVVEWEGGDRVCYAHWVRPTLLHTLSIPFPSWVTQLDFT